MTGQAPDAAREPRYGLPGHYDLDGLRAQLEIEVAREQTYPVCLTSESAASIRLPVTVTTSGSMESFVGRVFRYEGRVWTVTSGAGVNAEGWPMPRYWIAEYPDGTGERREVSLDGLVAMLDV